jgi:2-polyprenyl-3-methyl-5-hydroxy-6-metoxy-1,4-benzoquinol methylase
MESKVIEQLTVSQLRRLWQSLGHEFSTAAWGKLGLEDVVALRQCQRCSFEFFPAALAGNEAFYRELEHPGYFVENRPEFHRTLSFAQRRGLRRILDVGCGSGVFLDLARQAGFEACGLELNGAAAAKARAKGHEVFSRLLDQLSRAETGGGFDLITLFQVLEHVPDPVAILRQAVPLLNRGGHISVAVPSAQGVFRLLPWDPHQWPPHHMSRWRLADFRTLARAANLDLVAGGGDKLLGSEFAQFWNVHNQLAAALGRPRRPGGPRLMAAVSFLYRKTGMKFIFPRWGSSIYAYFRAG